ncbi:MAG: hypothetical protein V1707_00425 [bacterium]
MEYKQTSDWYHGFGFYNRLTILVWGVATLFFALAVKYWGLDAIFFKFTVVLARTLFLMIIFDLWITHLVVEQNNIVYNEHNKN